MRCSLLIASTSLSVELSSDLSPTPSPTPSATATITNPTTRRREMRQSRLRVFFCLEKHREKREEHEPSNTVTLSLFPKLAEWGTDRQTERQTDRKTDRQTTTNPGSLGRFRFRIFAVDPQYFHCGVWELYTAH